MPDLRHTHFATRAVHAGERLAPGTETPVSSAISPSVGYTHPDMQLTDAILGGQAPGYVYARYDTPSVHAFEQAVASLEGGPGLETYAQSYASGMAAIHGALLAAGVQAGTPVLAAIDLYGATYTLLNGLLRSLGVPAHFVDAGDLPGVEHALQRLQPRALLVETISNPLLKVADVAALVGLAHRFGARLLVDNTFASPYLYQPLLHSADFAIHSATKYLSGHGDVLAGVVVCADPADRARLSEINKLVGGVLGPFEAWLAQRGLKTLPLRMPRQCDNARQVAAALQDAALTGQARIQQVIYPGLESHPQHALAAHMFAERGAGGVVSFTLAGEANTGSANAADGEASAAAAAGSAAAGLASAADIPSVFRFMDALQLVQPATTVGDIYSLVLHPATASHRGLTPEQRRQAGIPDNLVRLSCGIEDAQDIIADILQAL